MTRSKALAGIALTPIVASGCASNLSGLAATKGSPSRPTAFGSQLYPGDDVRQAISLLAACGATLLRATADGTQLPYFDSLFALAAQHGMRVILISDYAPQPVDVAAYAASAAAFHRRYAAFDPIWELWNEPNLAAYWHAPPNLDAYAQLAIATAKALRDAGAREVLSGGTSGVDTDWIYGLHVRRVFDVATGCAVHSYKPPAQALNEYLQAISLLPGGVPLHTTEACVVTSNGQPAFFRDMWNLHRDLGLPTMVWCEFRDGTAGPYPPYTDPMGLVTPDYGRKAVYYTAQSLVLGD